MKAIWRCNLCPYIHDLADPCPAGWHDVRAASDRERTGTDRNARRRWSSVAVAVLVVLALVVALCVAAAVPW